MKRNELMAKLLREEREYSRRGMEAHAEIILQRVMRIKRSKDKTAVPAPRRILIQR